MFRFFRRTPGLVLISLLVFPVFGFGAPKPHIVLIETMPVPAVRGHLEACLAELDEMGLSVERTRRDIIYAEGDRAKAERELQVILRSGTPDVVVTFATLATQAAVSVLGDIGVPIVFSVVSDPVGSGIVDSLEQRPDFPITGRVYTISRSTKLNHVLSVLNPEPGTTVRFGVVHSTYPSSMGDVRYLREVAMQNGRAVFVTREIPYLGVPEGTEEMFALVRTALRDLEDEVDYWWEPAGPLAELPEYHRVITEESRHPVALGNTIFSAEESAILTMMPDIDAGGREIARIVGLIVDGVPANDIPIRPPETFYLAVNADTVKNLGLVVPSALLELAGKNIFRQPEPDE